MIRFLSVLALLATMAGPSLAEEVSLGQGATLRGLDKVNGETTDIVLENGGSAHYGRLTVVLGECRYPVGNPAGDAYAFLTIREDGSDTPVFQGWMMASAPALHALDNARYDVWVLRCNTSEAD
ncbi:hypothetical protein TG4357_02410 [Thalassovita gelatinovora]|uniref:DUF2155 domain-containing protein n=1 Tax=Thalassovita gelatinovora TaxID=53501 RepID=A0A0P1FEF1_THAGE|nr:DUF2155 domain-containing protein [Thalassovita gelatinovora]QIZ79913.1 DUF2155 domain-containing protein [Thalassovita gelatinovora]CUH66408.1 hypothetical protein TG4357_02410 [Thalassovita gelatinovora]SER14331.1 hypothetical protein SAMN04488043_11753 [Thalassovita gelatinovora]